MTGNNNIPEDGEWTDADDVPLETEQLSLSDDEERLPWLESSADDGYADTVGSEMGHTLRLAAMAVAALVALVGGIYWVTHRGGDGAVVADGSVVAADPKPYKEAPKDPGGKTFDGTGDSSFAVSEGKTKPATVAGSVASMPAPAAASSAKPGAAPVAAAPAGSSGGSGVQVGAFSSKDAAEAGWTNLVSHSGGALAGVPHRVIAGTAENGTIYRLQAVSADAAAAGALCGKLKAAGVSCQVK